MKIFSKITKTVRYILFPFSFLYGCMVCLRHWAYDVGIFKTFRVEVPSICIGNLSVGGTGKTPMVEYLTRRLQSNYRVGIVSRGYKRKTKGGVVANSQSTVWDLGDEPFQFWRKFPQITLVVDSNRVEGVQKMRALPNPPEVILLDDAFQHRRIEAKVNLLLTAYTKLFTDDYLLPTGDLRDVKSRASKADIIVVTKCPSGISVTERNEIIHRLNPHKNQKVFFTYISYAQQVCSQQGNILFSEFIKKPFTLVTGIANAVPLCDFLTSNGAIFNHLNFSDHHNFSNSEIEKLKKIAPILTTEKDFVRLQNDLPHIYYLPITTDFVSSEEEKYFWSILKEKI